MAKSADLKSSRLMILQAKMKETAGGIAASNGSAASSLGHMDDRERKVDIEEWGQICMLQRDLCFRESKTFLFCVCALIFRREAIRNARWKPTGSVSRTTPNLSRASPLKTWRRRPEKWRKALELGLSCRTVQLYGRSSRRCSRSMPGLRGPSATNGTRERSPSPTLSKWDSLSLWWLTYSPADTKKPDRVGGGRR